MGRLNKHFILILLLIGIFLLTGCDKFRLNTYDASEDETGTEATITPEYNQKDSAVNKADVETASVEGTDDQLENATLSADATSAPIAIAPAASIELPVYNVNADTAAVEPVTALIPDGSDITPQLIVDTVIDSLEDQSIIIEYDSVSTEEDAVIVSFKKDKAPYSNLGSGYEGSILDAIAQSLIDNLPNYNKVIYRIEGEPYTSGVFEYQIDEPHLEVN